MRIKVDPIDVIQVRPDGGAEIAAGMPIDVNGQIIEQYANGNAEQDINDFQNVFIGYTMQASPLGSTEPIRVAMRGTIILNVPNATYEIRDYLSHAENATTDGAVSTLFDTVNASDQTCVGIVTRTTTGNKVECRFRAVALKGLFQEV